MTGPAAPNPASSVRNDRGGLVEILNDFAAAPGLYHDDHDNEAILQGMEPWDSRRFQFMRVLAPALRSGGQVELYSDLLLGSSAAVKRVPREHCREGPEAFARHFPGETENPWNDAQVSLHLGSPPRPLKGVCRCLGVYRDANGDLLLASDYVAGGDLFSFASRLGTPGSDREAQVWPVVRSLVLAVLSLHSVDVAHGDVSLENALLTPPDRDRHFPQDLQVVLIDFAMASVGDRCRTVDAPRGKKSYQAPEMHQEGVPYDARAADLFACGVSAYCLAVGSYPWASTVPGQCRTFSFVCANGLEAFFIRKRAMTRGVRGPFLSQCLSPALRKLLSALLSIDPLRRRAGVELLGPSDTVVWSEALLGG